MENKCARTLYRPIPRPNKDDPNYAQEANKTLIELERVIQGHKGRGDGEQDASAQGKPLTALTTSGTSVASIRGAGGAVHRLRSTPLGMRRAIDIFLPRVTPDNPSSLPDPMASTATSTQQLTQASSVNNFVFLRRPDELENSAYKCTARHTVERARRLNLSFNRALMHMDLPSSSTSNGAFRDIVGHVQQKQ